MPGSDGVSQPNAWCFINASQFPAGHRQLDSSYEDESVFIGSFMGNRVLGAWGGQGGKGGAGSLGGNGGSGAGGTCSYNRVYSYQPHPFFPHFIDYVMLFDIEPRGNGGNGGKGGVISETEIRGRAGNGASATRGEVQQTQRTIFRRKQVGSSIYVQGVSNRSFISGLHGGNGGLFTGKLPLGYETSCGGADGSSVPLQIEANIRVSSGGHGGDFRSKGKGEVFVSNVCNAQSYFNGGNVSITTPRDVKASLSNLGNASSTANGQDLTINIVRGGGRKSSVSALGIQVNIVRRRVG